MPQPTQVLPYWLSASTTFVTTQGTVFPTTVVVNLPLTYYGPSIPLGSGWVYGGSTSPPPGQTLTSATEATGSAGTETPSATPSDLTSAASETASASVSPSLATSSGITISASSGATSASSEPSTFSQESSITASPSSVTAPITSTPSLSLSLSSSSLPTSSITSLTSRTSTTIVSDTTINACTTLGGCPTSTATPSLAPSSHHKLSTGAIVAISLVSVFAAVFLLACCIFIILRRRRRRTPNHGSSLEGNISALPPPLGEEQGSLLFGRRSGGESPDLDVEEAITEYRDAPPRNSEVRSEEEEDEELTGLPIAKKYITERRRSGSWASRPSSRATGSLGGGNGGRGTYQAVAETEPDVEGAGAEGAGAEGAGVEGAGVERAGVEGAGVEGAGVATAATAAAVGAATAVSAHRAGEGSGSSASHAHTHSSHGLFYASASNNDEHQRPGSPTSGGSHENAEVVTAQRATRSPLARLARLSWFARNRNAAGPSGAVAGLGTDSEDDGGWVNVGPSSPQMRERGGPPVTTPLLSQPPSGGGRLPIITRQAASRSNTALVDNSHSPLPATYFNVPRSRSSRRYSDISGSAQSGQTVFFDADEEQAPPPPAPAFMPPAAPALTLTPPAAATTFAAQPQRFSLPPSGSESSPGGPTPSDFPVPPTGLSPSPSYQWPRFRNSDSQNNDSASPSATTESPIPPGQALPGLFSRSLSGVGMIGAPITTSRGETLETPVAGEERRRHASEPNLREQAEAAQGGEHHARLSTLDESADGSWRTRALSPVAASAAAAISGASLGGGDDRSRRFTLGPASFVDTPQVVDQSEVASLRGDVHSSYTGNGTQSHRDSSYPSRTGQGGGTMGTMATHSTFSTGPAQRRLASTPHRPPSLSALGARELSMASDTAAGTASDSGTGTGTGTGSGTGGSSAQQSPHSVRVTRLTEMGELRPPQRAAVPPSLSIVGERMRPSIDTPPPPPSANPDTEALSPPPPRPWWRPYG